MERPVLISWDCYGCFEPVYSYLGKAAPCRNCTPTEHPEDDYAFRGEVCGYWVNGTGIEVTSRSDQIEQNAVWEEYDFRMEMLEEDWDDMMEEDYVAQAPPLLNRWIAQMCDLFGVPKELIFRA